MIQTIEQVCYDKSSEPLARTTAHQMKLANGRMIPVNEEYDVNESTSHACETFRAALHGSQLQQLFHFLPDVFFVVKNRAGRMMMANDVAVQLCGFEREADMIGKTDYELFSRERADAYVKDDNYVFETGESVIDHVELAPDPHNSINWFVTTKIPLYSAEGEIVGIACIARTMTNAHAKLRPYMEMNEVLNYVSENYAEPIKVEDMAKIMHLSSSQFERSFKKIFKISPTKHVLNVRVRAACRLLSTTNDTIASIALESGFYDHSHFIRNFRKVKGISPREYREGGRAILW